MVEAKAAMEKQREQCREAYTQDEANRLQEDEPSEADSLSLYGEEPLSEEAKKEEEEPFKFRSSTQIQIDLETYDRLFDPFLKHVAPKEQPAASIIESKVEEHLPLQDLLNKEADVDMVDDEERKISEPDADPLLQDASQPVVERLSDAKPVEEKASQTDVEQPAIPQPSAPQPEPAV